MLFLKAFLIGFSIAMPVGPIGMLCIRNTLNQGFFIGLATGVGAALADSFYGFLAGGGLVFLSQFLLQYSLAIKILGSLILFYLGFSEILNAKKISAKKIESKKLNAIQTAIFTFFLTLTSPMTILAYVGIFAAVGGGDGGLSDIVLMIFGVFCGSLMWWIILVGIVAKIRHKIDEIWIVRMKYFSGIILCFFGIYSLI
jgi:putative LysE/RhtB family amino acid efflux pump